MGREEHTDLLEALQAIDPASLAYQDWCNVGMALHASGFDWMDWDRWSAQDISRYHEGECERKWHSFSTSKDANIGSGTIIKLATDRGWTPKPSTRAFGWDDKVAIRDAPTPTPLAPTVVTKSTIDARDVGEEDVDTGAPRDATDEFRTWMAALFEPDDHVCVVTKSKDGHPADAGTYWHTRERIEGKLDAGESLAEIFGTPEEDVGAWAVLNPLDGKGRTDACVTAFRYALVESDTMPLGKQLALIHEMRLPCAAITYSGSKSVHAFVRVDAKDKREYRERVAALYDYCRASGFEPDEQNKNPSRLSRLPGFKRAGSWQRLVEADSSEFKSWEEWQDWVIKEASQLPEIENLADIMADPPPLAPSLIQGVLRDRQKMLVVGPSKAGKSFALMDLAICIAEGWKWMGHQCSEGRVLLVNFEVQAASMAHRFAELYEQHKASGRYPLHQDRLDVWNLRGRSAPLDVLVPTMVSKTQQRGYRALIIDPIYKALTGDENSASDMAKMCNQFDVLAEQMGCAVIYAHHHAKGEAGRRASQDRASGSGVFARDPDALLDMSPIVVDDSIRDRLRYTDSEDHVRIATPFRITYTLREFATPPPTDVIFRYPAHLVTTELADARVVGERKPKEKKESRQSKTQDLWDQRNELIGRAVEMCEKNNIDATVKEVVKLAETLSESKVKELGLTEKALARWTAPSQKAQAWCNWHKEHLRGNVFVIRES